MTSLLVEGVFFSLNATKILDLTQHVHVHIYEQHCSIRYEYSGHSK